VAVEGRGFFQIQMPDGNLAYTRDGSFQLSAQGQMVTSSGYVLQPGISIPDGSQSITIGRDGVVSVRVAGQSAPVQVGQLQLTDFVNPAGLEPLGENLLAETTASGPAQQGTPGQNGLGMTTQGSVEASNVNVVEELVNMIETQRAYEMNSKAISTADQMLEYVNNQL
jgi:flagellar basal-body rod protein FlgG